MSAFDQQSSSPIPPLEEVKKRPTVIIVVGMAGSGKTTFLTRLHREISSGIICRSDDGKVGKGYYVSHWCKGRDEGILETRKIQTPPLTLTFPPPLSPPPTPLQINLDPACTAMPYPPQIDIRDTVDYKNVMSEYNLGPNGAIVTSLNLFATKFDVVMGILEKRVEEERDIDYVIVDTPGQIESFTWSASGQIVTESLASSFPTILSFVVDTPRCVNPSTFMSNMLYSCSMMYRSRLPMVVAFNKTDVVSSDTVESWMSGESLRGFARVCEGLRGFARVCEGLRGFARVCEGLRGFVRVCEGVRGFARVCLGLVFPSPTPFN